MGEYYEQNAKKKESEKIVFSVRLHLQKSYKRV
jgi:hypothetical protein